MPVTTRAIILSSLKYGEAGLIVKAFTESDGLKSYLLKSVFTSKKGKQKAACFLPLMQLEIVAHHKNKGTLERLQEVKIITPYQTLHTHIVKNSIVFFLAEMLGNSIGEQAQDKELFRYLAYTLHWLDQHEAVSNFHLLFLLNLTRYLGFYPNTSQSKAPYFDLLEGNFCSTPTHNPLLEGKNLENFTKLLATPFHALHTLQISKHHRQELLKKVVLYFELHIHGFKKPKSLAVLSAVFQ